MSRTIKAIERSEPDWHEATASQATQFSQNRERKLVAQWQRGAEILGHAQRKLRLTFTPGPPHAAATY